MEAYFRSSVTCLKVLMVIRVALFPFLRSSCSLRVSPTTSPQKILTLSSKAWMPVGTDRWILRSSRQAKPSLHFTEHDFQKVLSEVESSGWKKHGNVDGKADIKEEEIQSLFNMIDRDRSGSLSVRVDCTNNIKSWTFTKNCSNALFSHQPSRT